MNDKKSIIKGSLTIFTYLFLNIFNTLPLYLFNIQLSTLTSKVIYLLIYQICLLIIFFLIYKKDIIEDFKKFNIKEFFNKYFKYWFILLFFMIISNLLIQLIYPGSTAVNEDNFRKNFELAPIYSFITASLIAPFIEEITFRMGIKNIFKNKYLFIILSGLIFGSLHVIGKINNGFDYLYLLPYCLPGFVLALVYYKSNNIFNSLFIHFIHNNVLLILQILL